MSDPSLDRDPFEGVAESFLARYRAGERPGIEEYAARHPELADQIRRLLPALVLVEQDLSVEVDEAPAARDAIDGRLRRLGDYRILGEIGRGGMGVVYEAEQVSLGRRVALKVLPYQVAQDPRALERFRREARSVARLHHTNIVPVFEVGQDGETAYYTMQFIQGQGLDQIIEELARLRGPGRGGAAVSTGGSAAAATGPARPTLDRVAQSLLTGRLATESAVALAGDAPASDGRPASQRPGPNANSARAARDTDPDDFAQDAAQSRPASAVLPGGAKIALHALSGRRPSYFRSVAQIGRQAAQGLAYAHSRGIIHRDIKPSNLLLDHAGVAWITDFGLAKGDDEGLTQSGDVLGTLRYLAPERFRGDGDARADIYSLGLTLYELLTLQPAFATYDRLNLTERIKTEEPARPRSLDSRISRDLETIVLKAIEKDPRQRYASAEAMAEDLRRFLDDEPIQARRASTAERYARWARRNPGIAALGAVLTAVLVLGTIGSLEAARRFARQADRARTLAIAERSAGEEADRRAKAEAFARNDADRARTTAQAETYHAVFSEARALRVGHPPGWREQVLGELARLAIMPTTRRNLAELRTEAAAALATPDIRLAAMVELKSDDLRSFTFGPDGRTLATAGYRTGLNFWDLTRLSHRSYVDGLTVDESLFNKVLYLPNGHGLAVATRDRGVVFTDTQGIGTTRAPITRGSSRPKKLALSADGRRIAVAWTEGAGITVHDAASGTLLDRFDDSLFALSPDGRWLARQQASDIELRPIASVEPRIMLGRHGGASALTFSPDGALLAVAFRDHTTVLWDVAKREPFDILRGHHESVADVAFSPDGEWIATGAFDYTVRVWETRTGQSVAMLSGAGPALRVQWSPTGDYLATSPNHGDTLFLNKVTGRHGVQQWLTGHRSEVRSVTAHPLRERIATSGGEELISWDLSASAPPRP